MLKKILVNKELHQFGGSGVVHAARSEGLCGRLADELEGKVQLIYLDPPFGTGGAFEFKDKSTVCAYSDALSIPQLTSMMRTVLSACHRLLCASGSLYLHVDYRLSARMRILLDEIFGEENFMNEIIWSYRSGGMSTRHFSRKHDNILFYRKSKNVYFNIETTGSLRGSARKNHMKRLADEDGRIYYSIKTGGKEYRYYEDDLVFPSDVWDDVEHLHQRDPERTGFNTQKPLALLKRIILASSKEGDTVLDFFGGSGTTAEAAALLGRSFISVDCGDASLLATRRRLIESARIKGLFETGKPFSILYDQPEIRQKLESTCFVQVSQTLDGHEITFKHKPDSCCAFAAAGRLDSGVFYAADYLTRPLNGEKLFLPDGCALHLVDNLCRQGFFIPDRRA